MRKICNDPPSAMLASVSSPFKVTALPWSTWSTPPGLCCWLRVDFTSESQAIRVQNVLDRRLISHLVGAVEQIDAGASGRGLDEDTSRSLSSTMPDHASLPMI